MPYAANLAIGDLVDSDTRKIKAIINSDRGDGTGAYVVEPVAPPAPAVAYSTDEADTGYVWLDGKPIYRKSVDVPHPNTGSATAVAGLTGIDNIINVQLYLRVASGVTIQIPINDGNTLNARYWINAAGGFVVLSNWSVQGAHNLVGWIEYTKI